MMAEQQDSKPLTLENLQELDKQHEPHEIRQFACQTCQKSWWQEVPARKPVAKCHRCKTKYDALPREEEFGIGHHECECGHTFHGFTRYGVKSPCFKCGREVLSKYFLTDRSDIKKKTHRRHKCELCNGREDCPNKKPLVNVSSRHISTGSTASSVCSDTEEGRAYYEDPHEEDRRKAYHDVISEGIKSLKF
jgi:hypothetical protein